MILWFKSLQMGWCITCYMIVLTNWYTLPQSMKEPIMSTTSSKIVWLFDWIIWHKLPRKTKSYFSETSDWVNYDATMGSITSAKACKLMWNRSAAKWRLLNGLSFVISIKKPLNFISSFMTKFQKKRNSTRLLNLSICPETKRIGSTRSIRSLISWGKAFRIAIFSVGNRRPKSNRVLWNQYNETRVRFLSIIRTIVLGMNYSEFKSWSLKTRLKDNSQHPSPARTSEASTSYQ